MGINSNAPLPSVKVGADPVLANLPKAATKIVFDNADSNEENKVVPLKSNKQTNGKKRKAEEKMENPANKKQRKGTETLKEASDSGIEESSDLNEETTSKNRKVKL